MVTSTKDNLQAHRFMNGRVRAALLGGDADGERPLGRLRTGAHAGLVVTVALLAVAGIVGVLRPGGSNAWSEPGAFIVENETGARYVFLDGALHPVLNYASARLLLGAQLHVVSVSVHSLESAPHGPAIGITSAPDALPDAADMAGSTWSVCAVGDGSAGGRFRTAILPGRSTDGDEIPGGQGYLLRTVDGRTFLVAQGHAFGIPDRWLAALGYRGAPTIEVANDFVASLPSGESIAPLSIAGLGEERPPLSGSSDPTVVGTVFVDRYDGHYVMTRAGLMALTRLQADLLLAHPDLASAYSGHTPTAVPISQSGITEAASSPPPRFGAGAAAPATAPTPTALPPGNRQLCVRYPADGPPDIVVSASDPSTLTAAGSLQLASGGGALVAVRSDADAPEGGGPGAAATTSGTAAVQSPSARVTGSTGITAPAGSAGSAESAESAGCDSEPSDPDAAGIAANTSTNTPDASATAPKSGPYAPAPNAGAGASDTIRPTPIATAPGASGAAATGTAGSSTASRGPMICLVTDTGRRYPLAGARTLQQLGLSGVSVAQLPAAVIDLLPIGPVLDPAAAAAAAP